METQLEQTLRSIQCFLDPNYREIARDSAIAKDVLKILRDQLKGGKCYTKIYSQDRLDLANWSQVFLTSIVRSYH